MSNDLQIALRLLKTYRTLNNLTVRDGKTIDDLHMEVDAFLDKLNAEDKPEDRWDAPERVEHRKAIRRLYMYD